MSQPPSNPTDAPHGLDAVSEPQPPAPGTTPTWYGSDPTGPQPLTPPHGTRFGDLGESAPGGTVTPAAQPSAVSAGTPRRTARPSRRLLELGTVAGLSAMLASGCTYVATKGSSVDTGISGGTTGALAISPARAAAAGEATAPDWVSTAAAVSPSVVAITVGSGRRTLGQGSGVIIDDAGRIITNNHVVSAGRGSATGLTLTVTLDDKRTYDASIVGTDPATDLAVVQIKGTPSDVKPIALGDANQLRVGEPVMAVGNPLGLAGTVTTGIVSALNRPVVTTEGDSSGDELGGPSPQGEPVVTNAVQTSAAINPGNSGGALVNSSGQLVGINSSIATTSGSSGNIGIGFAIPSNAVKSVAEQLIKTGKARHAYLGVSPVTAVVQDGASRRTAAVIQQVLPNTPAAQAGLKAGDAVIAVDGETVGTDESLIAQIRERSVNQDVTLTIVRDGKRQDVKVTLTERRATPN